MRHPGATTVLGHARRRHPRPLPVLTIGSLVAVLMIVPEVSGAQSLRQRAEAQCIDYPNGELRPSGPRTPQRLLKKVACDAFPDIDLPIPISNPSGGGDGTLYAGFAKLDIKVPDGYGMVGYGPEGRPGREGGSRPLYVRALVLEGARGETVAFALADLAMISTLLHREVAAIVHDSTAGAIGADRLMVAATHTHSAPGHYFSNWPINMLGSQVAGFSPELTEYLAERIAAAVIKAYEQRSPARAAWEVARVWGHTRNRSIPAARLNASLPALHIDEPSVALDEAHTLVNPRWAMLRVDTRDTVTGIWTPAGALSIFAIHGTGIPSGNEYYDADIPGAVAGLVERRFGDGFVYLFANGTEGDVSADWPPYSRCPLPRQAPRPRPTGPRTPPRRVDFVELEAAQLSSCLQEADEYVNFLGRTLADTAEAIIARLGQGNQLQEGLEIQRAFNTLDLDSNATELGLCERPMAGTATAGGAPDGFTRYHRWRLFGWIPLGIEAGGSAIDSSTVGCHRPKQVMAPFLQSKIVGPHQYPSFVQLAALRIGDMLVGVVPAEVTTMAGRRILDAMQATRPMRVAEDHVAILGIANGHIQYVTTREEYWAQFYEGASNLYGPGTAEMLRDQLASLTQSLKDNDPTVVVGPITVKPGPPLVGWPP